MGSSFQTLSGDQAGIFLGGQVMGNGLEWGCRNI
jgi:hypothetical protein